LSRLPSALSTIRPRVTRPGSKCSPSVGQPASRSHCAPASPRLSERLEAPGAQLVAGSADTAAAKRTIGGFTAATGQQRAPRAPPKRRAGARACGVCARSAPACHSCRRGPPTPPHCSSRMCSPCRSRSPARGRAASHAWACALAARPGPGTHPDLTRSCASCIVVSACYIPHPLSIKAHAQGTSPVATQSGRSARAVPTRTAMGAARAAPAGPGLAAARARLDGPQVQRAAAVDGALRRALHRRHAHVAQHCLPPTGPASSAGLAHSGHPLQGGLLGAGAGARARRGSRCAHARRGTGRHLRRQHSSRLQMQMHVHSVMLVDHPQKCSGIP